MAPQPAATGYVIQLLAVKERSKAIAALTDYAALTKTPEIKVSRDGGWFRVVISGFSRRYQAEQFALSQLQQSNYYIRLAAVE